MSRHYGPLPPRVTTLNVAKEVCRSACRERSGNRHSLGRLVCRSAVLDEKGNGSIVIARGGSDFDSMAVTRLLVLCRADACRSLFLK